MSRIHNIKALRRDNPINHNGDGIGFTAIQTVMLGAFFGVIGLALLGAMTGQGR